MLDVWKSIGCTDRMAVIVPRNKPKGKPYFLQMQVKAKKIPTVPWGFDYWQTYNYDLFSSVDFDSSVSPPSIFFFKSAKTPRSPNVAFSTLF